MTDEKRIEEIRERLHGVQYAIRCAKGAGAFGSTENEMLRSFQDGAPEDVAFLLAALDAERAR